MRDSINTDSIQSEQAVYNAINDWNSKLHGIKLVEVSSNTRHSDLISDLMYPVINRKPIRTFLIVIFMRYMKPIAENFKSQAIIMMSFSILRQLVCVVDLKNNERLIITNDATTQC